MSHRIATEMIQGLPQKKSFFFGYAISENSHPFLLLWMFFLLFKLILLHNKLVARKLILEKKKTCDDIKRESSISEFFYTQIIRLHSNLNFLNKCRWLFSHCLQADMQWASFSTFLWSPSPMTKVMTILKINFEIFLRALLVIFYIFSYTAEICVTTISLPSSI